MAVKILSWELRLRSKNTAAPTNSLVKAAVKELLYKIEVIVTRVRKERKLSGRIHAEEAAFGNVA